MSIPIRARCNLSPVVLLALGEKAAQQPLKATIPIPLDDGLV